MPITHLRSQTVLRGVSFWAITAAFIPAHAQSAPAAPPAQTTAAAQNRHEATSEPEDIIVTAARRPQRLQDTSIAVSAIPATRLKDATIIDTSGLQTVVPTLQYAANPGTSFVYLRGVGAAIFGTFTDNSVATYVDGIYVPRPSAAMRELFDVAGVEVLRGPQATYYGRNATGGAILLTSNAPSDTLTASGDAQFGNQKERRYTATISGPVIGDAVTGRLSVVRHTHQGDYTNLANGSHFNGTDFRAARGTLRFSASEKFEVTVIGNYSLENGTLGAQTAIDPNSLPFAPFPNGFGQPYSPDPRKVYNNIDTTNRQEIYGALLRANWDLGFAKLTALSSYNHYSTGPSRFDIDGSAAPVLDFIGSTSTTDFYSQDLQLTSAAASPTEWLAGFSLFKDHTRSNDIIQGAAFGTAALAGDDKVTGYAAFAQAAYRFTPELKLEAGLRYSWEQRDGTASIFGTPSQNKKAWNNVSPRVALDYKPSSNVLLYASATKGFKSGAFNADDITQTADPETIWSYEVGARLQPLAGWTLNLTGFHYNYTNIQVFGILGPATDIQNAGRAHGDGIELETDWKSSHGFNIGIAAAYLDARYAKGVKLDDTTRIGLTELDVSGNQMPSAPKLSGSIFAGQVLDLGKAGSIELYGDLFYQSKRSFTAFEDPTMSAGATTNLNGRITYRPANRVFYVAAYIRNATDKLVVANMTRQAGFGPSQIYNPGRRYGLMIGFNY